jgi:hypothetical protein
VSFPFRKLVRGVDIYAYHSAFVSQSSRVFAVSDANSAYNTAACQSADGTWSPLYLLVDGKDLDALEEREPGSGCVAVELQLG